MKKRKKHQKLARQLEWNLVHSQRVARMIQKRQKGVKVTEMKETALKIGTKNSEKNLETTQTVAKMADSGERIVRSDWKQPKSNKKTGKLGK